MYAITPDELYGRIKTLSPKIIQSGIGTSDNFERSGPDPKLSSPPSSNEYMSKHKI